MLNVYLDSYNKITVEVNKNYYDGKINNLYLRTNFGMQNIGELVFDYETEDRKVYFVITNMEIELGQEVMFMDEYGYKTLLKYRYIVKEPLFDEQTYTNENLEYEYSKEKTIFKLWAPIASECLLCVDDNYYKMKKVNKLYRVEVPGDLNGKEYYYIVKNNGVYNKILDPYSFSYNYEQTASVVIDLNSITKSSECKTIQKSKTIYEINVRDFSSSQDIKYKSKFLGVIEKENLEYLKNLGIEYLQIMPVNYFEGDDYNNENIYNWGYNPKLYGVTHPNYVYNLEDSYSIINECVEMVNKLHQKGIKVVLDVVFNHMENRDDNILNNLVPYYFFFFNKGKLENLSLKDGMDMDSSMKMCNKFIIDMCKRWVSLYGVDGFRFDLMGFMECETMNELYEGLKLIKKDILIYGEGWDVPTVTKNKASLSNASKIRNIGMFNDFYRENLKYDYINENTFNGVYLMNDSQLFDYSQSINYIECHDDRTYYDLQRYCENRDENESKKREMLKTMIILLSNGYAFIHSGQEFYGTKNGVCNSYRSLDNINKFDWDRKNQYLEDVKKISNMIKIRDEYHLFNAKYMYEENEKVITLRTGKLEIIINLSDKEIALDENKEVLLSTSGMLNKYDLVIYRIKENN